MSKDQPQALTKRQAKFVDEFLKDRDATKAAIRAGYAPKSARYAAAHNLEQPHVQEMLGIKQTQVKVSAEVDAAFVLRELKRVAEQEDVAQSTKVRALELIAKHLGMLEDRLSIKTDGLSAEQRAERVAVLIERASRRD